MGLVNSRAALCGRRGPCIRRPGGLENDVPFLGTCGGLQYAVIEFFPDVLGEIDPSSAVASIRIPPSTSRCNSAE